MTNDIIKSVTVVTPQRDWNKKSCGCYVNQSGVTEMLCDKHYWEMDAEHEIYMSRLDAMNDDDYWGEE